MIYSLSFFFPFLCCCLHGWYSILTCLQMKCCRVLCCTQIALCKKTVPVSFHTRLFPINIQWSKMVHPLCCVTLECDLSPHIWYWHSYLQCCRNFTFPTCCHVLLCHKCSNACNTHTLTPPTDSIYQTVLSLNLCLLPSASSVNADLIL